MSDNVTLPGTGEVVATDEVTIGGTIVKVQRMKLVVGADGAYQKDLSAGQFDMAGSIPVVIASDQSAVPVSGTLTIGSMPSVTIGAIPDVGLVNAGAEGESGRGEVPVKSRSLEASIDAMTDVLLRIEKLLESVVTD